MSVPSLSLEATMWFYATTCDRVCGRESNKKLILSRFFSRDKFVTSYFYIIKSHNESVEVERDKRLLYDIFDAK